MLDAMGHVIAEDFLFDATQRRANRGNLRDDIDAIAVLVDHAGETADLAFYSAETFER